MARAFLYSNDVLDSLPMSLPIHYRLFLLVTVSLTSLQCVAPSRPWPQGGSPLPQQPPPSGQLPTSAVRVSRADAQRIGNKIWQNEAAGTVAGLTAWNKGEHFASLGIGHFIWYPAGTPQTFKESFRPLMGFLQSRGVRLPPGLTPQSACPWRSREAFAQDAQSQRMRDLRKMLSSTVGLQTEYIINRMQAALPKMQQAAPPSDRQRIVNNFHAVAGVPNGVYALIDYTNFKGEGTNPKESYKGQGWGLLQVLQGMQGRPTGQAAAREFAASAKRTLARRIANAPRNESRWRAGWFRRCDTYAQPW